MAKISKKHDKLPSKVARLDLPLLIAGSSKCSRVVRLSSVSNRHSSTDSACGSVFNIARRTSSMSPGDRLCGCCFLPLPSLFSHGKGLRLDPDHTMVTRIPQNLIRTSKIFTPVSLKRWKRSPITCCEYGSRILL